MCCTTDVEPLSPAQKQVVAAYVSRVAPAPQHPLDIEFGDRVRLLGYDLDRDAWKPGQTLKVTWHWTVERPLGSHWKLFTHVADSKGDRTLNRDGEGILRWLYGPSQWEPGEYIRDVQNLKLPGDWEDSSASVYVGLWRDFERLPVLEGSSEDADRALAFQIETPSGVDARAHAGTVPALDVNRTKRSPRLDGTLSDDVWSFAQSTAPFLETRRGDRAPVEGKAKMLWNDRYLFVGIEVQDATLQASDREHDSHLWEQDCVELLIDPGGNGQSYFEIQVSPRGVVFDTRYDSARRPRPFGHIDWTSRVKPSVSTRGAIDDDVADGGYTVELAIPWRAFALGNSEPPVPRVGSQWRANIFVLDKRGQRQQVAAAWSPPRVGDFHVPNRFGVLRFQDFPTDMVGYRRAAKLSPAHTDRPIGPDLARRNVKERLIRGRGVPRTRALEPGSMTTVPAKLESQERAH